MLHLYQSIPQENLVQLSYRLPSQLLNFVIKATSTLYIRLLTNFITIDHSMYTMGDDNDRNILSKGLTKGLTSFHVRMGSSELEASSKHRIDRRCKIALVMAKSCRCDTKHELRESQSSNINLTSPRERFRGTVSSLSDQPLTSSLHSQIFKASQICSSVL